LLEGSPFPAAREGGGMRDSAEHRCACAWAHHAKRRGELSRRCKHVRYAAYFSVVRYDYLALGILRCADYITVYTGDNERDKLSETDKRDFKGQIAINFCIYSD